MSLFCELDHYMISLYRFFRRKAKKPIQRSILVISLAGLFLAAFRNFRSSRKWNLRFLPKLS